jgi:hypothetical protein
LRWIKLPPSRAFQTATYGAILAVLLVSCLGSWTALADSKIANGWLIDRQRDPFTDQMNVIVLRLSNGRGVAFRCLQGNLSIAVIPGKTTSGHDASRRRSLARI